MSKNIARSPSGNSDTIFLYFDGLCEPKNPGGVATFGVVIWNGEKTKLFEGNGLALAKPFTDEASNNVAEYSALIYGLKWLIKNGLNHHSVVIRGDSRLVVNQIKGEFKVKARRIVELYHQAMEEFKQFDNIRVEWVDRSRNSDADLQSRIAYSRFMRERKL